MLRRRRKRQGADDYGFVACSEKRISSPERMLFKLIISSLCYSIGRFGEVAEWSNVPDSKSGVLQGTVGSNPTLSAKRQTRNPLPAKDRGFFVSVYFVCPIVCPIARNLLSCPNIYGANLFLNCCVKQTKKNPTEAGHLQ